MPGEQGQHSFSAMLTRTVAVSITQDGVRLGSTLIAPADAESVCWGASVRMQSGNYDPDRLFALTVRSTRSTIRITWGKQGLLASIATSLRKPPEVVPLSEMLMFSQYQMWDRALDAVLQHIVPTILSKLVTRLHAGDEIPIGPCTLSSSGIAFNAGLLFTKRQLLPWSDCETHMNGRRIRIISKTTSAASDTMPARDTYNAVLLPLLCNAMALSRGLHTGVTCDSKGKPND